MSAKPGCRVYFVQHAGGLLSGSLIDHGGGPFDAPPPSAIGRGVDEVLRQLEVLLQRALALAPGTLARYLWDVTFATREVTVDVHPQVAQEKRLVIGAREIPLRLTYAWSALKKGGFRVVLPRFGWSFVVERLEIAPEVLRQAVSTVLLGESAGALMGFQRFGDEWVSEWTPRVLDGDGDDEEGGELAREFPTVTEVADEWVERVARRRLPMPVGEDPALASLAALASRRPLPSVLLVGPSGVGKTSLVRRLARHLLIERRAHPERAVPRLWATSATRMIAGMTYVGMWQERCLAVVQELAHEGDLLFVDRLVPMLQPQPDGGSIGEVLLPAAREGTIAVIAECTRAELEACRRRFGALLEVFQVVAVDEPATPAVLRFIPTYAQRRLPRTTLPPTAVRRMATHLATLQRDAAFPGKAVRFLDWIAASQDPSDTTARTLSPREVSARFARFSGIPEELIADEHAVTPEQLAATLRRSVIGQDAACASAARVLARLKAGLNDPERPVGTLLFLGPTGVGKTELARAMAAYLFGDPARMIRLDMSEYMFAGSGQRLLAVGQGSQSLATKVRERPLSLVLFDEIEKAHPEVFDLLLGMLGEGRLTDAFGTSVDCRMTVVVMTSNLGVSESRAVGFGDGAAGDSAMRAARRHFRPEFFNRLDQVIGFNALTPSDVLKIVDLEITKAEGRAGLQRRRVRLAVGPAARAKLAELGWHPTRGARPLQRVIEERVIAPIAAYLAAHPEVHDGALTVDVDGAVGRAE
ncbi:MAG: AAA family ATPase [Deltaproteobacteria bacterium]|nr:AAA family ATPase [Myxococcales bacterium]MDP3212468.1 AAA family ATPase [Deltaproteobacteria bacterium]